MEPHSDPLPGPEVDFLWRPSAVMVFFCDDLSEAPLTALVGGHLAGIDERLWIEHAIGWAL